MDDMDTEDLDDTIRNLLADFRREREDVVRAVCLKLARIQLSDDPNTFLIPEQEVFRDYFHGSVYRKPNDHLRNKFITAIAFNIIQYYCNLDKMRDSSSDSFLFVSPFHFRLDIEPPFSKMLDFIRLFFASDTEFIREFLSHLNSFAQADLDFIEDVGYPVFIARAANYEITSDRYSLTRAFITFCMVCREISSGDRSLKEFL